MAADFNKPVLADAYASVLQSVRDLAKDLALMLDNTGTQNIPTGAIKWNSANARFEKYNGAAWAVLASRMAQDVTSVMGYAPGNGSGALAVNNGTLNTNLNAQYHNGFAASQSVAASNVVVRDANGYIPANYINTTADVTGTTPSHFAVQVASDNYIRWRTLASIKSDLGVGAGASNIAAAGAYGGFTAVGATNGWAGFRFNASDRYFMSTSGQTGEYADGVGWQWRFDNGALAVGTVPWARISGVPSFPYFSNTGGNLSGYIAVANEGASQDPYGAISVTKPAVGDTPAYFSMTRAGQAAVQIGMDSSNRFVMGSGTSGAAGRITSNWMIVNGYIWASNYGWLHDYFTRTVNAGYYLTGGGSGPNLTISHEPGFSGSGAPGSITIAGGHITSASFNCNCNCGNG